MGAGPQQGWHKSFGYTSPPSWLCLGQVGVLGAQPVSAAMSTPLGAEPQAPSLGSAQGPPASGTSCRGKLAALSAFTRAEPTK